MLKIKSGSYQVPGLNTDKNTNMDKLKGDNGE